MRKIIALGLAFIIGGFFIALLDDSWSYFSNYTPPAGDIFYTLMITVWHTFPFIIMILGVILLILSGRRNSEVDY